MRLAVLTLQTVLLIAIVLIHPTLVLAGPSRMVPEMLLVLLQLPGCLDLFQLIDRQLDIGDQRVASASAEVLPHHDPHELLLFRVRGHRVRGDDPSTLTKLMRDRKLVELVSVGFVEMESHERQTLTSSLGHQLEAHLLDGCGKVVGGSSQVQHD